MDFRSDEADEERVGPFDEEGLVATPVVVAGRIDPNATVSCL